MTFWTNLRHFSYPMPSGAAEWDQQKEPLRNNLWQLLGNLPPLFYAKA